MSELKEAITIGSGAALVEAAMRVEELESENKQLREVLGLVIDQAQRKYSFNSTSEIFKKAEQTLKGGSS